MVLPVPRGPENRYACDTLCVASAFISVRVSNVLPGDVGKALGSPFAIEDFSRHAGAPSSFYEAWGTSV